MTSKSLSRPRWVVYLFLIVLVLLPVQYSLALWYEEPWPAIILPSFRLSHYAESHMVGTRPLLYVSFQQESTSLPLANFLGPVPRSHHGVFAPFLLRMPLEEAGAGHSTDEARLSWIKSRLHALYPTQQPQALTVIWQQVHYRPIDQALATTPLDTLVFEIH